MYYLHVYSYVFRKYALMLGMLAVTGVLISIIGNNSIGYAKEIECEDITGKHDWQDDGHDDNEASEKKFYKAVENEPFCKVNKMIDHEQIEGEIKEGTKYDMDWLKETIYYQSVDEEAQENLRDAYYNSPDSDGDNNLADYEMVEAGY